MKTGTLKELNVKPGDVVKLCGGARVEYTIDRIIDGDVYGDETDCQLNDVGGGSGWELISRADDTVTDSSGCVLCDLGVCDDTPTLWRDMTPEEKGALLLAQHDGEVVEILSILDKSHGWIKALGAMESNVWLPNRAYRIKPEPKVETVTIFAKNGDWGWVADDSKAGRTHTITFTVTDGKPDPASIKMEEL